MTPATWTETHGVAEVRFETRRYPGTVYVWAYWRLLGSKEWASVGDPDYGPGARARMRRLALDHAAQAQERGRPAPASP